MRAEVDQAEVQNRVVCPVDIFFQILPSQFGLNGQNRHEEFYDALMSHWSQGTLNLDIEQALILVGAGYQGGGAADKIESYQVAKDIPLEEEKQYRISKPISYDANLEKSRDELRLLLSQYQVPQDSKFVFKVPVIVTPTSKPTLGQSVIALSLLAVLGLSGIAYWWRSAKAKQRVTKGKTETTQKALAFPAT